MTVFLVHLSWWLRCAIVIVHCLCTLSLLRPSLTSNIFIFSFETTKWYLTKLDKKQDLSVLYQVCVFGSIRKPIWPPPLLICWDIFYFSSETAERNSTELDRKQDFNILYQVCIQLYTPWFYHWKKKHIARHYLQVLFLNYRTSANNYRLCCVMENTEIWLADTRNKVTFMFA